MAEGRIRVLGVGFDSLSASEGAERAFELCVRRGDVASVAVTPNPLMIMNAQENEQLRVALESAELSLADGVGVISAARRLSLDLPERVTGIDTVLSVLEKLSASSGSVFLLGARPGVAEEAERRLSAMYPGVLVLGARDGYFEDGSEREREIISAIKNAHPDLLILCLGSPRQEVWAHAHRGELSGTGLVFCLGGTLDVLAGVRHRAPKLFIRLRLEWLWRMMIEPRRFRAIPALVRFFMLTRGKRGKREE